MAWNGKGLNIYGTNGYLDWAAILSVGAVWTICTSARGPGKTYGMSKYLLENEVFAFWTRRTVGELDTLCAAGAFAKYNSDTGGTWMTEKLSAGLYEIYKGVEDEETGKIHPQGLPVGKYGAALDIARKRSLPFEDVSLWWYDEFIPEPHVKRVRGEGAALLSAYETINRNRELEGHPPLRVVMTANTINLGNPLLMELGVVTAFAKMEVERTANYKWLPGLRGGTLLVYPWDSPISERKAGTSLYKDGNSGNDKALGSSWGTYGDYKHPNYKEYKPYMDMGELRIYQHRQRPAQLLVSDHRTGGKAPRGTTSTTAREIEFIKLNNRGLALSLIRGDILFSSFYAETIFREYMKV